MLTDDRAGDETSVEANNAYNISFLCTDYAVFVL